ncbi:PLP-dependent aminotransferase family protein [Treponema sp.]|uniref:MocR-like pyridoxine biosynthesis transcription factor PdxR n=1 Tax=Treponema sp. TaxID=166 RepID=UPI00298EA35F|nr:PLP-dependent aminotransferase family protein [Treponema sp.]MCQ2241526.1 PLP-dependent aminotransferase family protein [Treponema sp.]
MLTYDFSNLTGPLYRELYQKIRQDILNGTIKTGEKLPSKRTLAQNLGVSTITVENAYDQLISEGYLYSEVKRGYFVSDIKKIAVPKVIQKPELNIMTNEKKSWYFDFSSNTVEAKNFPFSVWAKLSREVLSNMQSEVLQISPSNGTESLRKAIANHLLSFRGMSVDPNQIIIGAGTENLYEILIKLLGDRNTYCIENPGYIKIRKVYEINKVNYVSANLDENGISIEELKKSKADIAHISPNHHFPTGITMPVSRRYEILGWANEKKDRYIIEDDYDSEFRQNGNPIPTLQSIDAFGKVIYMNTFSKSIASTIRISYMVLPEQLANLYYQTLNFYSCPVPTFEQYTLSKFIDEGYFEKHINRMRLYYRRKRIMVLNILKKNLSDRECSIIESDSGLHLILKLNCSISDEKLKASLLEKNININMLSEYYICPKEDLQHMYLLNYSNINLEKFEKTMKVLKEIIAK